MATLVPIAGALVPATAAPRVGGNGAAQAAGTHPADRIATVIEVVKAMLAQAERKGDTAAFADVLKLAAARWPDAADRFSESGCALSRQRPDMRQAAGLDCPPMGGIGTGDAGLDAPAADDDEIARTDDRQTRRRPTGSIDLGASLSSGDTRERALSGRIRLTHAPRAAWSEEIALDGDVARRAGATSQQRLTGDHRLFYRGFDRLYVFNFLRGEYDRFAGFDWRITESVGLGYPVLHRPRHRWRLEGGPGVRFISLADSPRHEQEAIARLSSEYRFLIAEDWKIENDSAAFLGGEGITLENTVAIEGRINASLFGRVSFHVRYDTKQLAGISKLDTLSKFSLGYRF